MNDPRPLCGLKRAAVLCDVAKVLYFARAEMFDLPCPHWDALPVLERHVYLTMAEAVIDAVKPESPYFALAVSLSRAEGGRLLAFGKVELDRQA